MDALEQSLVEQAAWFEAKHGDPSRPGYRLLHPGGKWAPILERAADITSVSRDERGKGPGTPEPLPDGSYPPMTEAQQKYRRAKIEKLLKTIVKAGGETDKVHRLPDGGWTPERRKLHRKWLDEAHARYADVPNDHEAIVMGGLPGSGKTTSYITRLPSGRKVVSEAGRRMGIRLDRDGNVISHAEVNSDAFKEMIARDGLVPNPPGVSPMEAASLVHEESSDLAKRFVRELAAQGKNILFDGTLGNTSSTIKQLRVVKGLPDLDYQYRDRIWTDTPYRTRLVFVSVRLSTSAERAHKRWASGQDDYANGAGDGGRLVPSDVIEKQDPEDASFRSRNEENYEALSKDPELIDETLPIFDNEVPYGSPPLVVPDGKRPPK